MTHNPNTTEMIKITNRMGRLRYLCQKLIDPVGKKVEELYKVNEIQKASYFLSTCR